MIQLISRSYMEHVSWDSVILEITHTSLSLPSIYFAITAVVIYSPSRVYPFDNIPLHRESASHCHRSPWFLHLHHIDTVFYDACIKLLPMHHLRSLALR